MVETQLDIKQSEEGTTVIEQVPQEDNVSVRSKQSQKSTATSKKGGNKNAKVLKIVNMIFEKKKKERVTKLEAQFADGSKYLIHLMHFSLILGAIQHPVRREGGLEAVDCEHCGGSRQQLEQDQRCHLL